MGNRKSPQRRYGKNAKSSRICSFQKNRHVRGIKLMPSCAQKETTLRQRSDLPWTLLQTPQRKTRISSIKHCQTVPVQICISLSLYILHLYYCILLIYIQVASFQHKTIGLSRHNATDHHEAAAVLICDAVFRIPKSGKLNASAIDGKSLQLKSCTLEFFNSSILVPD